MRKVECWSLRQLNCEPFAWRFYLCDAMLARYLLASCVRPSVTHWYCAKTAERMITQTTPRDSAVTLVFWRQPLLAHSPWNLRSKGPNPFRTQRFRQISAHSASTMRASEKCSISTNRKSTTRFPTSHRWTLHVTSKSPKRWHKNDFAVFASKIQVLSTDFASQCLSRKS